MAMIRGLLGGAALALLALGCGSTPLSTQTARPPAMRMKTSWIRTILYQRIDLVGDMYDAQISVGVTTEDAGADFDRLGWAVPVTVQGHPGHMAEQAEV